MIDEGRALVREALTGPSGEPLRGARRDRRRPRRRAEARRHRLARDRRALRRARSRAGPRPSWRSTGRSPWGSPTAPTRASPRWTPLADEPRLAGYGYLAAARGELLRRAGRPARRGSRSRRRCCSPATTWSATCWPGGSRPSPDLTRPGHPLPDPRSGCEHRQVTKAVQDLMVAVERARDAFAAAVFGAATSRRAMALVTADVAFSTLPAGTGARGADALRRHLADDVLPHRPADLTTTPRLAHRRPLARGRRGHASPSPTTASCRGCCPASRPPAVTSRCSRSRWSPCARQRVTEHRTLWDHHGLLAGLGLLPEVAGAG